MGRRVRCEFRVAQRWLVGGTGTDRYSTTTLRGPTLVVVVGSYFAASISGTAEDWLSPTLRLASNVVAVSMPEEGVFPPQFRWPLRFEVFVAKFLFLRSFAVLEEDLLALQLRPAANKHLKRKRF